MALQRVPLVRKADTGSPPVRIYGENTTTAFSQGSLVKMATGKVEGVIATTSTTPYTSGYITTSVLDSTTVGIALKGSSGVDNTDTPVNLAYPDVEFGLPVVHATNASAIPSKAQVGVAYELVQFASNGAIVLGVGIDRTSNPVFVVTEVPDGSVGEVNGIVWGKIISAERSPGMI